MSSSVWVSRWQTTSRALIEAALDRSKSLLEFFNLASDRVSQGAFTVELFLQLDDDFSLILKFALILSKPIPKGMEWVHI